MLSAIKMTPIPLQDHAPSTESQTFELQGDKLGESFSTFVAKHPKADCADSTETRTNCYQWTDVSIFGMTAQPKPGCSVKIHSSPECVQGLGAQFVNRHLISLSYAVKGTDKSEATATLKKSFGSPLFDTGEATIWSHERAFVSVVVGKSTERNDGPTLVTFVISNS